MAQDDQKFPKTDIPAHQEEQIIRDFNMFNYHINSTKMRWLKDVVDIIDAHRFVDDFCHNIDEKIYNVDVVQEGQGDASYDCTDMVNGVLLLTTDNAEDDNIEITQVCECWKFVDCYPLYAEMRFKIYDVSESEFWFGLIQGDNYFTAPDNFAVFEKDSTDLNLEFCIANGGTGTENLTGHTLSDLTWLRLGFHWDGDDTVRWFVIQDGNAPQTILFTGSLTANIPTTELGLGFGLQNASAQVNYMYIDYIKCAQLRVIE